MDDGDLVVLQVYREGEELQGHVVTSAVLVRRDLPARLVLLVLRALLAAPVQPVRLCI